MSVFPVGPVDQEAGFPLLVFIDDLRGRLMQLHFVSSESTTVSNFEALRNYLRRTDARSPSTRTSIRCFALPRAFGRALAKLNIEIICANSSQVKGRVERVNRLLQDRLVKKLRLAGVINMADGNVFVAEFIERVTPWSLVLFTEIRGSAVCDASRNSGIDRRQSSQC